MFQQLSQRLGKTVKQLRGQARLTEDNIKNTIRDIRRTLLEADVALPVVKAIINQVKEKALGQEVVNGLNPGQAFIKIIHDELTQIMGKTNAALDLKTQPPATILVVGLQGAGKTTSVAKLANFLKEKAKKTVLIASTDVYRPAAIKQLETLAHSIDVKFFPSKAKQKPEKIAKGAIEAAQKQHVDILILDTAGRLAIDHEMMREIKILHEITKPIETLFVVDSMSGQDAANTTKVFNEALPLTGVVLTKTDGDARGGAALSVCYISNKPIKFIGTGEKIDALEPFHPERIASQILGMGDVLSLIEAVEVKIDKDKAQKISKKLKKGKRVTLEDFAEQLQQIGKMGGITTLMSKMPGLPNIPHEAMNNVDDNMPRRMLAIIRSMTLQERKFPEVIKASRKRRIAMGSGTQVQDVNRLLKQFLQMQKMLKKFRNSPMKLQNLERNPSMDGMRF